ncbi:phage tail sheath family protein [Catenuloplanes japonicus]|uniref:phage tail sheath family protein n=1 Tax=Catenuloplanes japonicus TaxID=33876 RepID=UPI0005262A01|nr:phage tail sheath subtilisin-like domain-containing protein [Catenuloplanes japonicus]
MSTVTSYPGVYVTEVPSGVRTITGVATSVTAFVGRTRRGPVDRAVTVTGFADYQRVFGGLWSGSTVGHAVRDFFANGGGQAVVVRVSPDGRGAPTATVLRTAAAKGETTTRKADLVLTAVEPGSWADRITAVVTHDTTTDLTDVATALGAAPADLFNLVVTDESSGARETIRNVTAGESTRRVDRVLEAESTLVRATTVPAARPADGTTYTVEAGDRGGDGRDLTADDYVAPALQATHRGLYALDGADHFNLLVVPPPTAGGDTPAAVYQAALSYCAQRRAVLLVDPPAALTAATAATALRDLGLTGPDARNAALFYPRLLQADPTAGGRVGVAPAAASVAGVIARTDATRGVWKAPAGLDATLTGIAGLQTGLTDAETGLLNPLGINCLRTFPGNGTVVWGARTLRGADQLGDEYKYLPVRRLALHIEESLFRGTRWVVFEPNDEPLWAQIRLNLGAFMHDLFRQGAFQGSAARDAYFVKCDRETTTATDVGAGRVNIHVGFAPVRPAEFVVLQIQQLAQA